MLKKRRLTKYGKSEEQFPKHIIVGRQMADSFRHVSLQCLSDRDKEEPGNNALFGNALVTE